MAREGEKQEGGGGGDKKGNGGKIQGSTNHNIIFAKDRPIYFIYLIYLFAADTYTLDHMYPYQLLAGFTKKKK